MIPYVGRIPPWLLIVFVVGFWAAIAILTARHWQAAFAFIRTGIGFTIIISLTSFAFALIIGLITGLGILSSNKIFHNVSSLYVQVIRGIPIIVQLYFIAFVITPALIDVTHDVGDFLKGIGPLAGFGYALSGIEIRQIDMIYRAIAGLAVAYGAFEAEVFRAGIESIERGQMEAARSLGMSHVQAMRYIILPQAIRVVLPPLGNDFISMLKDSSLVSILAVRELTHVAQLHRARTFRSWESLGTVAFLYLILTLSLSFLVRRMEKRMEFER